MRKDERHGPRSFAAHVQIMNANAVDFGFEIWELVQRGLSFNTCTETAIWKGLIIWHKFTIRSSM